MVVKTMPPLATCSSSFPKGTPLEQMPPVFGLHRLLPQQLHRSRKRVKQLVVQIIAVGDDDDGGGSKCL
jgi:hypothetical protein